MPGSWEHGDSKSCFLLEHELLTWKTLFWIPKVNAQSSEIWTIKCMFLALLESVPAEPRIASARLALNLGEKAQCPVELKPCHPKILTSAFNLVSGGKPSARPCLWPKRLKCQFEVGKTKRQLPPQASLIRPENRKRFLKIFRANA